MLLLPPNLALANDSFFSHDQPGVSFIYPKPLEHVLPEIIDAYHHAKNNLYKIFSWPINTHVKLILINDRKSFLQIAEHPLTVAFAQPSKSMITLNYQAVIENPFSLETTLQHELCHILLGEQLKIQIPRWLNEGISQWASEGITEIMRPQKNLLQTAAFSGKLIPFYQLENSFPMASNAFVLAYEQSQSFVVYLVQKYHKDSFLKMLELLKQGQSLHTAMRSIYEKSLHQLEHEWVVSQTQFFDWLIYVINNLYTFLFTGLSFISIIGFIRLKRKKWQYPDDWEDDML